MGTENTEREMKRLSERADFLSKHLTKSMEAQEKNLNLMDFFKSRLEELEKKLSTLTMIVAIVASSLLVVSLALVFG